MQRISLRTVLSAMAMGAALWGSASFAQGSLADLMGLTQLRHIKIWYAARSNNWGLVDFELRKLDGTLVSAAVLYDNVPIEFVAQTRQPLEDIRAAAQSQDFAAFSKGYAALTASCNSCHKAAGLSFIRIGTPTASPFTDQDFAPETR